MGDMKELIDEAVVEKAFLVIAIAGPLLGLAAGAVYASVKHQAWRVGLVRGFALGLLGPLILGLWRLYSWLVRYQPAPDPADDYFGLERVDILLLNIVIFVATGALLGWLIRRIRDRDAARAAQGPVGDEQVTLPTEVQKQT